MSAQNAAAAAPTTGVVPAAADAVSALTAAQFASHAQMYQAVGVVPVPADVVSALAAAQFATHAEVYQAISAQAAAIHEMSVNTLATSGGSYAATEAANAIAAG